MKNPIFSFALHAATAVSEDIETVTNLNVGESAEIFVDEVLLAGVPYEVSLTVRRPSVANHVPDVLDFTPVS